VRHQQEAESRAFLTSQSQREREEDAARTLRENIEPSGVTTAITASPMIPDDAARLDDLEQSQLEEALRLSVQTADRLDDLGKFQLEDALRLSAQTADVGAVPIGPLVMSARMEGSTPITTRPVSSVQHTEPPATNGIPHAGAKTTRPQVPSSRLGSTSSASVPPVSTRPDLFSDVIRQALEDGAPPTKRLLINKVDHTDEDIQAVKDYVRGKHFRSNYDTYETGFQMWSDGVRTVEQQSGERPHFTFGHRSQSVVRNR
jgi:hypothetical protein